MNTEEYLAKCTARRDVIENALRSMFDALVVDKYEPVMHKVGPHNAVFRNGTTYTCVKPVDVAAAQVLMDLRNNWDIDDNTDGQTPEPSIVSPTEDEILRRINGAACYIELGIGTSVTKEDTEFAYTCASKQLELADAQYDWHRMLFSDRNVDIDFLFFGL